MVPQGFKQMQHEKGHIGLNGPYYFQPLPGGGFSYGFLSDEKHGNPNGFIHGAALFSFVDTAFGHLIVDTCDRHCATISMTTDFIASVAVGEWIQGQVQAKRFTRSLAFVEAKVSCGGELLLSASAIFKLFSSRSA